MEQVLRRLRAALEVVEDVEGTVAVAPARLFADAVFPDDKTGAVVPLL